MTVEKKEQIGNAQVVDAPVVTDNWSGGGDQQFANEPDRSQSIDLRGVNAVNDELAEIDKKIEAGVPFESDAKPTEKAGEVTPKVEPKTDDQPADDTTDDGEAQPDTAHLTDDDYKSLDEKYLAKLLQSNPNLQRYQPQGLKKILENYNNGVAVMERVRNVANGLNISTLDLIQHMERLATDTSGRREAPPERRPASPELTEKQIGELANELAVKPDTVKSIIEVIKASLGLETYEERIRSIEGQVNQTRQVSNEQQWNSLWNGFSSNPQRAKLAETIGQESLWNVLVQLESERPGFSANLVRNGQNPYERALKEYIFTQKPELLMEYMGAKPNTPKAPNVQVPTNSADKSRQAVNKKKASDMTTEELERAAAQLTGDGSFISISKV